MDNASNDTQKSLIVITGSPWGIGRAITLSIADSCHMESTANMIHANFPLPVHLLLIARSSDALILLDLSKKDAIMSFAMKKCQKSTHYVIQWFIRP